MKFFLLRSFFCICVYTKRGREIVQKFFSLKLSNHLSMGHSTSVFSFFLICSLSNWPVFSCFWKMYSGSSRLVRRICCWAALPIMMVGGWAFDLSWGGPEAKLLLTFVSLSQRKHRLWEQTFKLLKEHYKKENCRGYLCFILRL